VYSEYYGFTGRPFQLTPDPRFYFESATHKKAMAYLGYGLAQAEGFIVVTGEIGAGKTTLTQHLLAQIDTARVLAAKIVSTNVAGDDVLRLVASVFGIVSDTATKAQLLDRIEQFLNGRAREGRKVLLIVDEAQNLPTDSLEELRMLSNFQSGNRALLQIFLLGQPEFRDKLASPELEQMRQRVIATHHLLPMESREVGPYIEHRLKLVGWSGRPHFSDAAYEALHTASGGIPRRLNGLVERVLVLGAIEQLVTIDAGQVDAVVHDQAADEAFEPRIVTPIATGAASSSHEATLHPATLDLAARIAMLEAQAEEQGVALRRVLTLLIDWVEQEGGAAQAATSMRSPAA